MENLRKVTLNQMNSELLNLLNENSLLVENALNEYLKAKDDNGQLIVGKLIERKEWKWKSSLSYLLYNQKVPTRNVPALITSLESNDQPSPYESVNSII